MARGTAGARFDAVEGRTHSRAESMSRLPGVVFQSDRDYWSMTRSLLDRWPASRGAFWIFAYGSLLWRPAFTPVDARPGLLHGWHRAFCSRVDLLRGTPQQPGLMMSLARGGCCRGVLLRLPARSLERDLEALLRREIVLKPSSNMARWVRVRTPDGLVPAIAFVADTSSPRYVGRLPAERVAEVIGRSRGPIGSMAEYLYRTVESLDQWGIRDRNLWRLHALVTQRLAGPALPSDACSTTPPSRTVHLRRTR